MLNYFDDTQLIRLGSDTSGTELAARQVNQGGSYGLEGCLTHEEEDPLIEFYTRYVDRWCFVSRYYRETLTGNCAWSTGVDFMNTVALDIKGDMREHPGGLCLCGSLDISCTADQVRQACG